MPDDPVLAAVTALSKEVATIGKDVASLNAQVASQETEATAFRVAVMDRFNRVETRLTNISDDITVTTGRADKAAASADNTRGELRALSEELAILTRKTRRIEAQPHDLTRPPGLA